MEMNAGSILNETQPNPETKVQVIEDGVEITDPNRIRPDVMQFVMLAKMVRETVQIRKYFDDRTPNGYIEPITVNATQVRQRIGLTWVAQSASIINDGPDSVLVWVNTIGRPPHPMNLNEVFNINFEVHKLKKLYFQCDPGDTASVRIVAQD